MCNEVNWRALLRYKAQDVVASVLELNNQNKFYKNVITQSSANFSISSVKYQIGGQYQIVVVKTTASPITISLPASSIISGTTDNTFTLTGASGTKYLLEYTHDGTNFIWKQVVSSSSSSSGLLTIVNVSGNYILQATDSGKLLYANSDQITIPTGLPIGFNVQIVQVHPTTPITFIPSGVTMNEADGNNQTAKQFASVSLISVATNVYNLSGYTA